MVEARERTKKKIPPPEIGWLMEEKTKLEDFWRPQKERMAEDQLLYELFRQPPGEGESDVVLNDIRVQINKVVRMIASAEWRAVFDPEGSNAQGDVSFGQDDTPQAQKDDAASLKEKVVAWVWEEADIRWRQGLNPGLLATMEKHLVTRGMLATRVKIDADYESEASSIDGEDDFPFEIMPLDSINIYPRLRGRKIAHILHIYKTEWGEITAEWGIDDAAHEDTDEVEVVTFYSDTYWGVAVDGEWVKEPEEHGYGFCPVIVDVAEGGEFRAGPNTSSTEYAKHIGTPLLEDMRQNYLDRNRAATMRDVLLNYAINPARVEETEEGKAEDLDTRSGAVNTRKAGRAYNLRAVPMLEGLVQGDLGKLEADLDMRISWAGMPRVTFGEVPGPLAGYAIASLTKGAKDVLTAWIDATKGHIKRINRAILTLIVKPDVGVGQLEVRGQSDKLGAFRQIVSPESIGRNFAHDIEFGEVLPADLPGLIDMGKRATDGENPLFSTHTWREKFGQNIVPDNRAEFERILKEKAAIQAAAQSVAQNLAYGLQALRNILGEAGMTDLMGNPQDAANMLAGQQQGQLGPAGGMSGSTLPIGQATGLPPTEPGLEGFAGGGLPPEAMGGLPPQGI